MLRFLCLKQLVSAECPAYAPLEVHITVVESGPTGTVGDIFSCQTFPAEVANFTNPISTSHDCKRVSSANEYEFEFSFHRACADLCLSVFMFVMSVLWDRKKICLRERKRERKDRKL